MISISVEDFIILLRGVKVIVTADGIGDAECEDLAQLWARVVGAPRFTGDAWRVYDQPGTLFNQIANTPTNSPSRGSLVVFSQAYNNGPGHVVLATGRGNANTFEAASQNDPLGSDIEVKTYKYTNAQGKIVVRGWLTPKTPIA